MWRSEENVTFRTIKVVTESNPFDVVATDGMIRSPPVGRKMDGANEVGSNKFVTQVCLTSTLA